MIADMRPRRALRQPIGIRMLAVLRRFSIYRVCSILNFLTADLKKKAGIKKARLETE